MRLPERVPCGNSISESMEELLAPPSSSPTPRAARCGRHLRAGMRVEEAARCGAPRSAGSRRRGTEGEAADEVVATDLDARRKLMKGSVPNRGWEGLKPTRHRCFRARSCGANADASQGRVAGLMRALGRGGFATAQGQGP